jgi:hypothetical protein
MVTCQRPQVPHFHFRDVHPGTVTHPSSAQCMGAISAPRLTRKVKVLLEAGLQTRIGRHHGMNLLVISGEHHHRLAIHVRLLCTVGNQPIVIAPARLYKLGAHPLLRTMVYGEAPVSMLRSLVTASCPKDPQVRAYASSMNNTPPRAACIAAATFSFVWPTYLGNKQHRKVQLQKKTCTSDWSLNL